MKANINGILECDSLLKDISKSYTMNYYEMPITAYSFSDDNCEMYNHIVSCLKSSNFKVLQRTPSGGIKNAGYYPSYDIRSTGSAIEITIVNYGGSFRLQWRNSPQELFEDKRLTMTGHSAFQHFKTICRTFKIDLNNYAHINKEKALKEKNEIEPALIRVTSEKFLHRVWNNVHHIDFHSSYMSGLVNTHPEFRDVVEYIYSMRKSDDIKYKAVLNMTQGYMQSALCKYKFAHLSRDMIKDNNDRIRSLVEKLLKSKRIPLLLNTDGIWYTGEMYHDENEGTGICTWGHDHTNCKLRIKSSGSYEYEENGKYYPVVRGYTNLDKKKPREEWQWGDIYNNECDIITYIKSGDYIKFPDGALKGVRNYE